MRKFAICFKLICLCHNIIEPYIPFFVERIKFALIKPIQKGNVRPRFTKEQYNEALTTAKRRGETVSSQIGPKMPDGFPAWFDGHVKGVEDYRYIPRDESGFLFINDLWIPGMPGQIKFK